MVLSLSTAFAATIDLQNVIDGETYTAYKILNYTDNGKTGDDRAVSYYLLADEYTSIGSVLEAAGFAFTASADGTQYFVNNAATGTVSSAEYSFINRNTVRQKSFVQIAVGSYGGMRIGILLKELLLISRYVQYAVLYSIHIMDNIAPVPVMEKLVPERQASTVDRDIIGYCSAIAQARRMLKLGIISLEDFEKIDHVLLKKYNMSISSLFRDKELL